MRTDVKTLKTVWYNKGQPSPPKKEGVTRESNVVHVVAL